MKVSRNSTVLVRGNIYSVASQLIGERVEIRIYAEHLEVWYGSQRIDQMPRLRGVGQQAINYRHIIHSLVRKPGAFAHYRYQQSLFPRLIFRLAYDDLEMFYPSTADRQYVRILELAAQEGEERVAEILDRLLEQGEAIREGKVRERLSEPQLASVIERIGVDPVELSGYDALLTAEEAGL